MNAPDSVPPDFRATAHIATKIVEPPPAPIALIGYRESPLVPPLASKPSTIERPRWLPQTDDGESAGLSAGAGAP